MTRMTINEKNMCMCMMRPADYCIVRCCMLKMQQNNFAERE